MKRFTSLVAVLVLSAGCSPDQPSPVGLKVSSPSFAISAGDDSDPSAGNYLVRFKGNGIPADFALRVNALGGEVIFAHAGVGIAAVSGFDQARADKLAALSSIAGVDADAYTTFDEASPTLEPFDEGVASPEDPTLARGFVNQWNMRAIQAPAAWAATPKWLGVSTVRVGILDTGIDYLEPDLLGRVDLVTSKSFLSATENARVQAAFPGAHEIADLHYHGTHVAATVASNAYSRAGVTSQVTLVGLKVCAPGLPPSTPPSPTPPFTATCPTSAVLGAMLYAADEGLDVINMSLGGTFNRRNARALPQAVPVPFIPSFIATINRVFNYVHNKGTTVVVSAGNGNGVIGFDLDHDGNGYKAYCSSPHVICVSATGPTGGTGAAPINVDATPSYSNYGRSAITVAAPGGNALSVSAACSGFTIVSGAPAFGIPNLLVCRTRYFKSPTDWLQFNIGLSGTSMASPHVAGLAALVAGEVGKNPGQITARISGSADQIGPDGNSPQYGAGRINVARAMGVQ